MAFKLSHVQLIDDVTGNIYELNRDTDYIINGEKLTFKYIIKDNLTFEGILHVYTINLQEIETIKYID